MGVRLAKHTREYYQLLVWVIQTNIHQPLQILKTGLARGVCINVEVESGMMLICIKCYSEVCNASLIVGHHQINFPFRNQNCTLHLLSQVERDPDRVFANLELSFHKATPEVLRAMKAGEQQLLPFKRCHQLFSCAYMYHLVNPLLVGLEPPLAWQNGAPPSYLPVGGIHAHSTHTCF